MTEADLFNFLRGVAAIAALIGLGIFLDFGIRISKRGDKDG